MIKEFHPQLLPKVRDLAIKANRRVLSRTFSGNWLSTFKGRGMEFSDYRQYTPGDDASMIDWKASLRAHKILVKELSEEKNLNVFILLDVSNSMLYGSDELLKAELAAQLVSSISYVALRAGDAVGLMMFNEGIAKVIEPNIGVRQHNIILDTISKAENYGGGFNFGKSMAQFMGAIKDRGLIIIISDFIGLEERWQRYLEIAHSRFEIIGLMVRDPRDRRLPRRAGEFVLEDPYSNDKIVIDCAKYWKPYKEYVEREEHVIKEMFRMVHGDLMLVEMGEDFVKPLMRFFHKRSLQVER